MVIAVRDKRVGLGDLQIVGGGEFGFKGDDLSVCSPTGGLIARHASKWRVPSDVDGPISPIPFFRSATSRRTDGRASAGSMSTLPGT